MLSLICVYTAKHRLLKYFGNETLTVLFSQ
nr:MAG TPA: hypothetical protein [Caudoviricetes sp.]